MKSLLHCGERGPAGSIPWAAVLCYFILAMHPACAGESFEPLIVKDAETHQGLTEFRSSNGLLDIDMEAVEDTGNEYGATMPPLVEAETPDADGEGEGLVVPTYPRLAFHCRDATHEVTSFGGPLLRVQPGDVVHIHFTNGLITQRTNLHFHGLEIPPDAERNDGTFGDYVFLPYVLAVAPGNVRNYSFKIPLTQPPGLIGITPTRTAWRRSRSRADSPGRYMWRARFQPTSMRSRSD